jgi:hypothetical protein
VVSLLHTEQKFDRSYGVKIIEFIAIYLANNPRYRNHFANIVLQNNINLRSATDIHKNDFEIASTLNLIPTLIDLLLKRKWRLVCAPEGFPIVTSDNPVIIYYENESIVPAISRNSPGFGMPGTVIIFPVSKQYALMGVFENLDETIIVHANEEQIAALNTKIISFVSRQIYTSTLRFKFIDSNNVTRDGNFLLIKN